MGRDGLSAAMRGIESTGWISLHLIVAAERVELCVVLVVCSVRLVIMGIMGIMGRQELRATGDLLFLRE